MKKLIIFDFDGVIVDSFEYCLRTNQSLRKDLTAEVYRSWFEGNFYETDKGITKEEDEKLRAIYWERFLKDLHKVLLFPGTKEVLEDLAKKYQMAIISSALSEAIDTILKREKIEKLFSRIYGSDYHESKVKKFQHVLSDFKLKPDDCVFITDTLGDLIEAEKVGIESIAVSWGFHDRLMLEKGKKIRILDNPMEITKSIENF